jgi:hypothetical protein
MTARLLRFVLEAVIFFLLLADVIALLSPTTGLAEKAVLALVGIGLIALAARVRRIGAGSATLRGA